jgi:alkylated DNA repair dioxygenase AlkB
MAAQLDLFGATAVEPQGFRYADSLVSVEEAAALTDAVARLPFTAFEFHGFTGRRRTVSFGWKYDFSSQVLRPAPPIPQFLISLRQVAAAFAGEDPDGLAHALVTEYEPGAAIGWHRDRPEFHKVIGISLGASAQLRFRRRTGAKWRRVTYEVRPRSAYLLDQDARDAWEHSIPPAEALRYSITFRTLR